MSAQVLRVRATHLGIQPTSKAPAGASAMGMQRVPQPPESERGTALTPHLPLEPAGPAAGGWKGAVRRGSYERSPGWKRCFMRSIVLEPWLLLPKDWGVCCVSSRRVARAPCLVEHSLDFLLKRIRYLIRENQLLY